MNIYLNNVLYVPVQAGKSFTVEVDPCTIDDVRRILPNAIIALRHKGSEEALLALFDERDKLRYSTADKKNIPVDIAEDFIEYAATLNGPRVEEGKILTKEEVQARGFTCVRAVFRYEG